MAARAWPSSRRPTAQVEQLGSPTARLATITEVPAGPAVPVGPAGPVWPAGPGAPASPWGPCGPGGPSVRLVPAVPEDLEQATSRSAAAARTKRMGGG